MQAKNMSSSSQESDSSIKALELNKLSKSTKLGVLFALDEDGAVFVRKVDEGGIVSNSDLKVGDKILSVNGTEIDSHKTAASILRSASGRITVVAQGEDEQPHPVEILYNRLEQQQSLGDVVIEDGALDLHKKEESSWNQCGCW